MVFIIFILSSSCIVCYLYGAATNRFPHGD
uniref:Uncharacterized protein n=1 Tax=Anguilla anguilla TaxID=7936 RepID=A0A0E9SWZ7_ANGAN